jgi:hypothetical protein
MYISHIRRCLILQLIDIHTLHLPVCSVCEHASQDLTLNDNSQASWKNPPLASTYASHVENPVRSWQLVSCPGIPEPDHTVPAQSPLWQD